MSYDYGTSALASPNRASFLFFLARASLIFSVDFVGFFFADLASFIASLGGI